MIILPIVDIVFLCVDRWPVTNCHPRVHRLPGHAHSGNVHVCAKKGQGQHRNIKSIGERKYCISEECEEKIKPQVWLRCAQEECYDTCKIGLRCDRNVMRLVK